MNQPIDGDEMKDKNSVSAGKDLATVSSEELAAQGDGQTRVYCSTCDKFQLLEMVDMGRWGQSPDNQVQHNWGDLLCSECHLVIATLAVDKPGVYRFVKVGEIYADDNTALSSSSTPPK